MNKGRYVLSKAKEVFNEDLKETQVCHAGMMCTSTSHETILSIANNADYDSVISERKNIRSLSGRKKNILWTTM